VIYEWIDAEKARRPKMNIAMACRVMGVSTSGFYGWRARGDELGPRAQADAELLISIEEVHERLPSYGSPRVHQELRRRDVCVGRHRVARVMREAGVRAQRGRPKSKPRAAPPKRRPEIGDFVRRNFTAHAPNLLWCIDVTQIRTKQGWFFAAVIIDAYSRFIVGWSSGQRPTELPMAALTIATAKRRPPKGGVVHSDRGYQFTAWAWIAAVRRAGMHPSMGRVGAALDNAMIESWFSSFKNEALHPRPQPATRADAHQILVQHIAFHNERRLHSSLDYRTPVEHEKIQTNLSV
jgi:putative transposase